MTRAIALAAASFFALAMPAQAAHHRHFKSHASRFVPDANGNRARLVTVPTAAGISITVAKSLAPAMTGFIGDLVARGIRPDRITCLSHARSHVRRSLHRWGGACDFDGSANRFAAMNDHRISDLAHKWGLRDGCDFNDCGHIDAGRGFAHRVRLARRYN